MGRARQKHRELLSAVAGHDIAWTVDVAGYASRNGPKQIVSLLMSEGVVVDLEVVGIDHQHRQRRMSANRPIPFGSQTLVEPASVRDARQRVRGGEAGERFFNLEAPRKFGIE